MERVRIHVSLAGHRIEFPEPSPAVSAFLSRLEKMVADEAVTENDMILVLYSKDNPVLDTTVFPERGAVTREVLADPVYAVQQDLLFRKHVAQEGVDVATLAAAHTLALPDAAKELGVTEGALRQAIYDRRLASWVKDGRYFLAPNALKSYAATKNRTKSEKKPDDAAPHPLDVCVGHGDGLTFHARHLGKLEGLKRVKGEIVSGRIPKWKSIAVLAGATDGRHRFYLLTPSDNENTIEFGPFFVRGRFDVVKETNDAEARAKFKAFVAE